MKPTLSPYALIQEANDIMKKMILDFPRNKEEKVLKLINAAETYPNMSSYQITQARIMLIDLYISHKIYGNAYDLCNSLLEFNPKAPVKKKVKQLEIIMNEGKEDFAYSCDINIVDIALCYAQLPSNSEGDMESLPMHDSDETSQAISDTVENFSRTYHQHSEEEGSWDALRKKVMKELRRKAEEEDNIYDEEFEKMLEERLSKLDELSRSEFYRLRKNRKNNGVLSAKDIDLLTLEAMEKSYNYRKDK